MKVMNEEFGLSKTEGICTSPFLFCSFVSL